VITLLFILRKDKVYKASQGWIYFLLRMLIASIVLILLIGYFGKEVDYLRQISEFSRFLYIIKIVLIGMVGYFLSLWILGIRIKDFSNKDVFD
jgi:putative peptidoglycan lipid II flippase